MILSTLNLNENVDLEFSVEIFGTTEKVSKSSFVIEANGYNLEFPAELSNGDLSVKLPKLKGLIESGIKTCYLRVEVNDKVFYPLKEQIELNPLVEFDVKTKKVESIKEGVKITVKGQVTSEDSKPVSESTLEKNIQKAIKSGYEVSKIGENYVMKKGDLYAGLISEKAILKSKKLFETLTQLVESLTKE